MKNVGKEVVSLFKKFLAGTLLAAALFTSTTYANTIPEFYTVQAGDSLWKIQSAFGVSVQEIRNLNQLTSDSIIVGQTLRLTNPTYIVQPGDSLWIISTKVGVSINDIRLLNNLTSDQIMVGQVLKLPVVKSSTTNTTTAPNTNTSKYIVKAGDTLWIIANNHKTTVDQLRSLNNLKSDTLNIGQELLVPTVSTTSTTTSTTTERQNVLNWPSITYIVQAGDTTSGIARRFGISLSDFLKYNYLGTNDWVNAGQRVAINGYAPRMYTVTPGEASQPARVGKIVDWFLEGQYILRRNDTFLVTDVDTGRQFRVKMMGGYNHSDVEPITVSDTETIKQLFNNTWTWAPRAVVIYKDGMNIAASLSGMPHSFNTINDNNVEGHFDIYLLNSQSHSQASATYIQQHQNMVYKAAGQR